MLWITECKANHPIDKCISWNGSAKGSLSGALVVFDVRVHENRARQGPRSLWRAPAHVVHAVPLDKAGQVGRRAAGVDVLGNPEPDDVNRGHIVMGDARVVDALRRARGDGIEARAVRQGVDLVGAAGVCGGVEIDGRLPDDPPGVGWSQ